MKPRSLLSSAVVGVLAGVSLVCAVVHPPHAFAVRAGGEVIPHTVLHQNETLMPDKPPVRTLDGQTCLNDLVTIRLGAMIPWQTAQGELDLHQEVAVQNHTNSYLMVNLAIHYEGSYTSVGYTHSPQYPVAVEKRPSLLLEPKAQAKQWRVPVKGVYRWVPNGQWELTVRLDPAHTRCYQYAEPPPHWDADSDKRLKAKAS